MKRWLNWREIEKMNVWGVRRKDREEALRWDAGAGQWEQRAQREGDAGDRQVRLMTKLRPEDTVLDVGCGTGPLSIPLARRVKKVYALDSSQAMLNILMEKARSQGLSNIVPILGNWYEMEPGRDFPICDIAAARHAPCQSDILGFSKAASQYCYSLWNVAPLEEENYHENPGVLSAPGENPGRVYNEPNGRLFGFHVHFNILYDAGANPEVKYDIERKDYVGHSPEEILNQIFPPLPGPGCIPEALLKQIRSGIREKGGVFYYQKVRRVSILGWNPQDITF